jgi:hypothetical protein
MDEMGRDEKWGSFFETKVCPIVVAGIFCDDGNNGRGGEMK